MRSLAIDFPALLADAAGRAIGGDEHIAIAVSGGPDSLALLGLAAAAFPGRVLALTVDHGLRAAAAIEAASVARQCADRGIAQRTLVWEGAKPATNLQAAARSARYAMLATACGDAGIGLLATAHHADDQAETLLMRLARGSGGGLAGIRRQRRLAPGVLLVRPVLGMPRAALHRAGLGGGWDAVDDPSNQDLRFDRTRARAVLAANPWLDVALLAGAAAHAADNEAALGWLLDRAWAGAAVADGQGIVLDTEGLPAVIVHRLVVRALATLVPGALPRGAAVARMVKQLHAGAAASLAGVRAQPLAGGVSLGGGLGGWGWHFSLAPPRRTIQARQNRIP